MKIQEVYPGKFRVLWEKVPLKNYVTINLGIAILTVIAVFLSKGFLPPEVPLFYGNVVGESQLVKTQFLFLTPIVSILVLIFNVFLSTIVKDLFLKKVLIVSALFVSILITITIVKIIFLVGFF